MKYWVSAICDTVVTIAVIALMMTVLFITGIGDIICSFLYDNNDDDNDYKGDLDEYED